MIFIAEVAVYGLAHLLHIPRVLSSNLVRQTAYLPRVFYGFILSLEGKAQIWILSYSLTSELLPESLNNPLITLIIMKQWIYSNINFTGKMKINIFTDTHRTNICFHIQYVFWVFFLLQGGRSMKLDIYPEYFIQYTGCVFSAGRALCPAARLYSSLPPLAPAPSSSARNRCLISPHPRVASWKRFLRGLARVDRASTRLPSGKYTSDIY